MLSTQLTLRVRILIFFYAVIKLEFAKIAVVYHADCNYFRACIKLFVLFSIFVHICFLPLEYLFDFVIS